MFKRIYEANFVNGLFFAWMFLFQVEFKRSAQTSIRDRFVGNRRQLTTCEGRPNHPNEDRRLHTVFRVSHGVVRESACEFSFKHWFNFPFLPCSYFGLSFVRLAVTSAFTRSGRGDGEWGGAALVC